MTPSPCWQAPRSPGWTRAAWLILRDPEQAKDAVQNALVRAWRDLPTLRDPDRFDAWLHRLLVRACIDEARRHRRHRVDFDLPTIEAPVPDDLESAFADRDQLERGFVRLEPGDAGRDRPPSLSRPAIAGGRGDAWGSRWAPRSRGCTGPSACSARRSTPTRDRARASRKGDRHDERRAVRPEPLRVARRGGREPRARRTSARCSSHTTATRQRPAGRASKGGSPCRRRRFVSARPRG